MDKANIRNNIVGNVETYTVAQRLNQMESYLVDQTDTQTNYLKTQIESQNSYIQEHAIQGEKGVQALNPIEVTDPYPISEKLTLQVSQFNRTPVMGDTFIYMYTKTGEPEERYAYVATILSVDGNNVTISAPAATDKLLAGPQGAKGEDGTDGRGVSSFVAISHAQEGNETVTNVQVNYTEGAPDILEIHAQNGADGQSGSAKYIDITDVPSTSTQGTLTAQQRAILDDSPWDNYIRFYGEKFYPQDIADDRGYRIYTHHGETQTKEETTKMIYLTLSTNAWSMSIISGGASRYRHNIYVYKSTNEGFSPKFYFSLENDDPTPFNSNTVTNAVKLSWGTGEGPSSYYVLPYPVIQYSTTPPRIYIGTVTYDSGSGSFRYAGLLMYDSLSSFSYDFTTFTQVSDRVELV